MTVPHVKPSFYTALCLALGVGLTFAAGTLALKIEGPRTSGPVSVSLQNEINAAIDRGREWLVAQQNADGSWGSNTCVRLTSLATLALAHNASPDEKLAVGKAGKWLLSPATTNTPTAFAPETMAWRELAMQVAAPADPKRTANLLWRLRSRSATNGFTSFAVLLIREAVAPMNFIYPWIQADTNSPPAFRIQTDCILHMPAGGVTPTPGATNALVQLASLWSAQAIPLCSNASTTRQYWILARFINRAGGGALADAQGHVVDWRNDLAMKLVSSQTIDTKGHGGYWPVINRPAASPTYDPIEETAFALLALDEL